MKPSGRKILFCIYLGIILLMSTTSIGIYDNFNEDSYFSSTLNDEWNKTFGGVHSDVGHSVQQTSDDGYIIAGKTGSFSGGVSDVWLIKTDSNGNEMWNRTFGGDDWDEGRSVQQTSDDGYIILGRTNSYSKGDMENIWLIKTDSNGNEMWNRTFGGGNMDWGFSAKQTNDGGYIIVGETWSWSVSEDLADAWLIKTDSNGNEMWNRTFGGSGGDGGFSVQQTNDDNGYIIVGSTSSFSAGWIDVWLIKTDSNGNEIWNRTFAVLENDVGWSVQQTSDRGYIITGFTGESHDIYGDVLLIKTDEDGNKLWVKTFGGKDGDAGYFVKQTSDGGYIITGLTYSFGSGNYDSDLWLIKTDSNGNLIWDKTYGGNYLEAGYSVKQTKDDNGYIVVGDTYSLGLGINDVWLIRTTEPIIHTDISGGFGLSIIIKNLGSEDISNIQWSVDLSGIILIGKTMEGSITLIPAYGEISVKTFVFGFGSVVVRATAENISYTSKCYMIGPFVTIK